MTKILIFGGTTEGRVLAEKLAHSQIHCDVSVVTEYGGQVIEESEYIHVLNGRKPVDELERLFAENAYDVIVDATHPYAASISASIQKALKNTDNRLATLIRIERSTSHLVSEDNSHLVTYFDDEEACARALADVDGRILITTGSKRLPIFCQEPALRERIVARVLPAEESLRICFENGLDGKQIIAMQGPFTKEMNLAQINDYGISALVTKETGSTGGADTKVAAAIEAGIKCFVISKPADRSAVENHTSATYTDVSVDTGNLTVVSEVSDACRIVENTLGVKIRNGLNITLAGIGPGNRKSMTIEVREAIDKADYIFGAPRMIDSVSTSATRRPYYLEKDIIPELNKIAAEGDSNVTILFSGDTGFFSGADKLAKALRNEFPTATLTILPGLSTISVLASRLGIPWQNATILSLHGQPQEKWGPELINAVNNSQQVFFLTSGADDIRTIGDLLRGENCKTDGRSCFTNSVNHSADSRSYRTDSRSHRTDGRSYRIDIGYQLSYPEEKLYSLKPEECGCITEKGLYAGMITVSAEQTQAPERAADNVVSDELSPSARIISNTGSAAAHGIPDEEFIRGKVPMTKEEIREISISKLRPRNNSIIYDIGSGTGSVAVELARLSAGITVHAVESNPEAVELIKSNAAHFGCSNINVVEGLAPDALEALPTPDCAFIGGTKGNLRAILDLLYRKNPAMRIVINAVTLETLSEIQSLEQDYPLTDGEILQVAVSRANRLGAYHLMQAANPVFICSFNFSPERI